MNQKLISKWTAYLEKLKDQKTHSTIMEETDVIFEGILDANVNIIKQFIIDLKTNE